MDYVRLSAQLDVNEIKGVRNPTQAPATIH
jgi:hypothetical protein